jgi:rhodanese-related sulfurtransferase
MIDHDVVNGVPTISVQQAFSALGQDYIFVDVRRAEEYVGELGHVDSARLATLGEELEKYLEELDKSKKIIFLCRSGMRSSTAATIALSLGFQEVYNTAGGMIAWNEHGYKVVK